MIVSFSKIVIYSFVIHLYQNLVQNIVNGFSLMATQEGKEAINAIKHIDSNIELMQNIRREGSHQCY